MLAKATKIIPVMIMGKIVSGLKYKSYEYVVAVLISVGMALFLFGSQADNTDSSRSTQVIGVLLLLGKILHVQGTSKKCLQGFVNQFNLDQFSESCVTTYFKEITIRFCEYLILSLLHSHQTHPPTKADCPDKS